MRHEFLDTGEPGYHPIRKLHTIASGLRYAVIYDFSVAWNLVFRWECWSRRSLRVTGLIRY